MSNSVRKGLVAVGVIVLATTSANAALTLPDLSAGLANVELWFGTILGGLAIMWGFRKITSTTNKT